MKHFTDGGSGKGERAFKLVIVRVFNIGNKGSYITRHRARAGHVITEEAVDKLLDAVADQIEKRFPDQEYEMVEVGEAHFNFVWRGQRERPWTKVADIVGGGSLYIAPAKPKEGQA